MYCRICGTEDDTRFYPAQRRILCRDCRRGMPAKIGREEFDRQYWGPNFAEEPEGIRREFYEDYLCSRDTLAQYKRNTTEEV